MRVSLSRARKIFGSAELAILTAILFHVNCCNSTARVISQVVANKVRLAYFEIIVISLFGFFVPCVV